MSRTAKALLVSAVTLLLVTLLPVRITASDHAEPCGTVSGLAGISVPDIRCGNKPNLAESYGPASYAMYANYGADMVAVATMSSWNSAGSFFFQSSATVAQLVLTLVEWAFTVDLVTLLGPAGTGIARALHDYLYEPALILAGLALGWYLLVAFARRRHGEIWNHTLRALLAMVVSAVFMANPLWVPKTLNDLSHQIALTGMGAVARVDPALDREAGSEQYRNGINEHPEYAGIRFFGDAYMRAFVYAPWAAATFGGGKTARTCYQGQLEDGVIGLASGVWDGATGSTWNKVPTAVDPACSTLADATLTLNSQGKTSGALEVQEDQAGHNSAYFKGNQPGPRAVNGFITLITVVISALMLGGLAATAIISQFAMELLTALAPIVFLVGITPPGQRILLKWAQMMFACAFLAVAAPLLISVMLVLSGSLGEAIGDTSWWWLTSLLELLLVTTGWFLRRPLLHAIGSKAGVDHHAFRMTQMGRAKLHAEAAGPRGLASMVSGSAGNAGSLVARGRPLAQRLAAGKLGAAVVGSGGSAAGGAMAAKGAAVAAGVGTGGVATAIMGAATVAKKGLGAVRKVHSGVEGHAWNLVNGHLTDEFRPVRGSTNGNGHGGPRLDKTVPVIPSRPAGNGNGHRAAPAAATPNGGATRSAAARRAPNGGVELVRPDGTPINGNMKANAQKRRLVVADPITRNPRGERN